MKANLRCAQCSTIVGYLEQEVITEEIYPGILCGCGGEIKIEIVEESWKNYFTTYSYSMGYGLSQ